MIKNNLTIENKSLDNLDNKFYKKSLLKFSEIIKDINLNKKTLKFFNIFDESFKLNFLCDLKNSKNIRKCSHWYGSKPRISAIFKSLENKIKKNFFL